MAQKSIKSKLSLLLALVVLLLLIVASNYYMVNVVVSSSRNLQGIVTAESLFYDINLTEEITLRDPGRMQTLQGKYARLRQSCGSCHPEPEIAFLADRPRTFAELFEVNEEAERLYTDVHKTLLDLVDSIRYIHVHHISYLKNIAARGELGHDDVQAEQFERGAARSASEVDIIAAAVAVHASLLNVFDSFYALQHGASPKVTEQGFSVRIGKFFSLVNKFEDYSLDSQDGLLVENLLLNGREFEKSFRHLVALEGRRVVLSRELARDKDKLLGTLGRVRVKLRDANAMITEWIGVVQAVALVLALFFVGLILLNSKRVIGGIIRTVVEARKIQDDLTYRINIGDHVFDEFRIVFSALNSMAGKINEQLRQVRLAHDVLEQRVEERTVDLARTNAQLERQVAARKQVDLALRESEEQYRSLFENATDLIQSIDVRTHRFLYVNPAWRQAIGYSDQELAGLNLFDMIDPSSRRACEEILQKLLDGQKFDKVESIFLAQNGRQVMVEGTMYCKFVDRVPHSIQGIFRDVTERRRMEEEQLRAQKLESLGVLAGGIAHDFNNLLTAVQGYVNLAKLETATDSSVYEMLTESEKALTRTTNLTQQLLTFAKGGAPIRKSSFIKNLIRDSARFVLRGSNVKCDCILPDDLWPVHVDEGQISQVIQNLAINADQAMPEGGTITVVAENTEVTAADNLSVSAGRYVKLSVIDHGVGIAEENLVNIFDPYFSTKSRGSGLGLAAAYSIIHKHEGLITVESVQGQGSSFHIYLPASIAAISDKDEQPVEIIPGKGRVLVMDDEDIVLRISAKILQYLGYEATLSIDGRQAVELYQQAMADGKPFAAVILDLTIPGGIGGREAVEMLRRIDPDVKAIVSSGYANDPIMAHYEEHGFCGVVPKPYNSRELSGVLHRVICGA